MKIEKRQGKKLASFVLLAMVLATGVLLGMAWDREAGANVAAEGPSASGKGDCGNRQDGEPQRPSFWDKVGLTPEQREAANAQLEEFQEEWRELRREAFSKYGPRFEAIMKEYSEEYDGRFESLRQRSREKRRALMTDEQRVTYDSLLAEIDRQREDRKKNGHHGYYNGSGRKRQ